MKTIGLIGGMSWESTMPYYRLINETVKQRLGGLHSAKIVLYSVDFHEVAQLQAHGNWVQAGELLAEAARSVARAGADCIVLCTNTMHKVVQAIESAVNIPFLHIADATAQAILEAGLSRVGLLGTRFTMEQDFYKQRLTQRHGITVQVPNEAERALIHRVIYDELCLGQIHDTSRAQYSQIIQRLVDEEQVQAVILGCTEISLLVSASDSIVPLFDTTAIHARAAAEFALS